MILKGCECLSKDDKSAITDAMIIKEALLQDAFEESQAEEKNLSKIDIRTHVPSESIKIGLDETKKLREKIKSTPICK